MTLIRLTKIICQNENIHLIILIFLWIVYAYSQIYRNLSFKLYNKEMRDQSKQLGHWDIITVCLCVYTLNNCSSITANFSRDY